MGGFPPPHITWWIGTRQLQPQQTVYSHHQHHHHHHQHPLDIPQKKEYQGVATSKLLYVPDIVDDGRYLTCRSERINWSFDIFTTSGCLRRAGWRRAWKTPGRSKCSVSRNNHYLLILLLLWSTSCCHEMKKSDSLFADKPQVSLRLGASLDPDNLRTGSQSWSWSWWWWGGWGWGWGWGGCKWYLSCVGVQGTTSTLSATSEQTRSPTSSYGFIM